MTKILLFLGQFSAEVILSAFSFIHRQNAPVDRSYKDDIKQNQRAITITLFG